MKICTTKKMYNILIAKRVWANTWQKKTIGIFCDNLAVVNVLNSGKAKDMYLAAISRNIFMESSKNDIDIKVLHVPGKNNIIANLLSRWQTTVNAHEKLSQLLPHKKIFRHKRYLFLY